MRIFAALGLLCVASWMGAYLLYQATRPCARPIPYSIGEVDERFGISREDFRVSAGEAADAWGAVVGRDLFTERESGGVVVGAEYDVRQETLQTLETLGTEIDGDVQSLSAMRASYDSRRRAYDRDLAQYEADMAVFETVKLAYENEVSSWNARGGATPDVIKRLNRASEELNARVGPLNARMQALVRERNRLNALGREVNALVEAGNATVDRYRDAGSALDEEFQAGIHQPMRGGGTITVYAFEGPAELRSVLLHEFGHALGLDHVEDETAILYRLNEPGNRSLTPADVAALKAHCAFP